jgi:DNA-directed RNA polymerase specialized sigma24 family protein
MSRSSEWGRPDRATDSRKEADRARLIHVRDDYPGVVNGDAFSDLKRRYWALVVTACEWRAYKVESPEDMANRVFASVDHGKPVDLRDLFRAVEKAVAQAYRSSVASRSSLDAIRGLAIVRRDVTRPGALIALSALREGDRRILQHAYWDELDPHEIAEVLGTDLDGVHQRLDMAEGRLTTRLVKRGVPVDDVGVVVRQIKPGSHRRRP